MNEEREKVYQILELGKYEKNLHHKKGFGGLLFIDLSMIKFSKLSSYIRQLDKENQELKKQLEKKYNKIGTLTNEVLYEENTKLINQQKTFIKWLEDEVYTIEPKGTGINYNCEYDSEEDYISAMKECSKLNTLKKILQKYKEIIGVDK